MKNIKAGRFHECSFTPPGRQLAGGQLTMEQVNQRRPKDLAPIMLDIAIFIAKSNISVHAACDGDLRSLLLRAFKGGWEANATVGKSSKCEAAAKKFIPKIQSDRIQEAFQQEFGRTRDSLIKIFRAYRYVGLSIDGVTIKNRKFLNFDVLHPLSQTSPFTFCFDQKTSMTTSEFVTVMSDVLIDMHNAGLNVAGVTSDGCSFQKKALTWSDKASIQQSSLDFRRLIFVPCLCHRLQNSIVELFAGNGLYADLIRNARDVAVRLRKPNGRRAVGKVCPFHCATRWIYDYPIVHFIRANLEKAQDFLRSEKSNERIELNERVLELVPLLEKLYHTVHVLERDNASIGEAFPTITGFLANLGKDAETCEDEGIKQIYSQFGEIVRRRTLDSTGNLFQLAYVLTPTGRTEACEEIVHKEQRVRAYVAMRPIDDPEDWAECAGLWTSGDLDSDEEEVLFLEGTPGEISVIEAAVRAGRQSQSASHDEQDSTTILTDDVTTCDTLTDVSPAKRALAVEATEGLRNLLTQYDVSDQIAKETLGAFGIFLSEVEDPLEIRTISLTGKNRYPWALTGETYQDWALLADIALRLEALICNEAVSERTNGNMRRVLAPFRMKMAPQTLLSRMTIARHATVKKLGETAVSDTQRNP
jgi:hypothetical protein